MEGFRIVEYSHALAEKVADMWNQSAEGWNGMNMARTADMVIREHNNAHHLNVYLAVSTDDEVVGYCSLDKYTHDEGALYINLLNVRPDYHGRKVGKMLVLACVNRTVELGWPRVDLYTWPGNTKAVPLYKKCGFFWEKRENSTHLMNFMPAVLKTEALQDFFQDADWYADSKRIIEIKPDGRRENGFDYLEYSWELCGKHLRVEFERTGRGMRLIETDDYRISAEIAQHELVFGMDYEITYHIANKSGKPLKIELNGRNDKNIAYAMQQTVEIPDAAVVKGLFRLNDFTEEQKPERTHPCVVTELLINGRKALFKTGVLPAYPANITLHLPGHQCYLEKEAVLILELENKFRENAVFNFTLPTCDGIEFPIPKHSIALKPEERMTIEIPFLLRRYLFYSECLRVTARLANGATVPFTKKLSKAFRGRDGIMWGQDDEFCEIFNGPFMVHLNKQDNCIWANRIYADGHNPYRVFPKVGRPFSSELSVKKADHVECLRDGEAAVMKAVYVLDDFPGLRLSVITHLETSGIIRHHYEVENTADAETSQEIWLSDTFRQDLFRGVMPYENRFVHTGADTEWTPSFWDSGKITENWFFSQGDATTRGVCWEPEQRIQFDSWCMFFEYNLGKIPPGGKAATKPVTFAMGVFDRWQDFRAFALKEDVLVSPHAVKHTSLEINAGNPFVGGDVNVVLKECRNMGEPPVLTVSPCSGGNPEILSAAVQAGSFVKEIRSVIFRRGGAIDCRTDTVSGKKVFRLNNGLIAIEASPDFSYALYSLKYRGNEWFDSSFPTPCIKSWWNPWSGGITVHLDDLSPVSMLDEPREASFVTLPDKLGNVWQGIKMSIKVTKNEKNRGLELDLYHLTMPGLPVLCSFVRIHQNTGRHFPWQFVENGIFISADPDVASSSVRFITKDGESLRLKAGKDQYYVSSNEPLLYESPNRREKLLIHTDTENQTLEAGVNISLLMAFAGIRREMRNGEKIALPPVFLIFTEEYFNSAMLRDLNNIQFDFGGEIHADH
jgi:ribosomal protein S18 acetylase RimI-like enzyme